MTTTPTLPLPAVPPPSPPPSGLFAPPAPRRRATGKVLAATGAVVLLVGGLAVHAAAGPSGPSGFRTAVVGTSDVDQMLTGVGTVEPVTQASVGFPVAGTVASVSVAVGNAVTVGQTLATLNGASLQTAIDAQQAVVDQAQLVLANARDGVSSGGGSSGASSAAAASSAATSSGGGGASGGSGSSSGRGGGTSGGGSSTSSSTVSADLFGAQQDVLSGQQAVDATLQSAQQALASAGQICAAASSPTSTSATAPTTSTTAIGDASDGSSSTAAAPAASAGPDPSAIVACQTALQGVLDAQHQVSQAQTSLGTSAATYDQLLDQRAAELASASSQSSASSAAATSSRSSSSAGGGGTVTSADLIKDQSAVDAAAAQLAVAQQALKQATIVSPIAGTVASVGLAVGDAVTAGSSTATIVVVGTGGVEVTMTVSVDRLPAVALGQNATIRPDGSSSTLTGKVVAIGAPATATNGTTTYPVSIGLPDGTTGLRDGSVASVSIITKAASHALVVPTAAVHTAGTAHTVNIVSGTTTKAIPVKVGAIGATWTEITSGLQAGQKVVLADLEAPLPTSATQVTSTRTGAGATGGVRIPGGFGGGGGGGGGTGRRTTAAGG